MKDLKISQELAQKIVNYLTERPFKEVASLVAELLKLEPIKEEK